MGSRRSGPLPAQYGTDVLFTDLPRRSYATRMETSGESNARRQRERRARIAAAALLHPDGRLCPSCGKANPDHDERFVNCAACRKRTREVRDRIVAQGLCCACKKPSQYGVYCASCHARREQAALHKLQAQVLAPYRGILILDQSTAQLWEPLRSIQFQTFELDLALPMEQREALLAHRVLVTRRPKRHRLLAARAHAALVDVSELEDGVVPGTILRHARHFRLVGKVHFLLKLQAGGKATIGSLYMGAKTALLPSATQDAVSASHCEVELA